MPTEEKQTVMFQVRFVFISFGWRFFTYTVVAYCTMCSKAVPRYIRIWKVSFNLNVINQSWPQKFWVFRHFPSSGVFGSRNTKFWKLDLFPSIGEDTYSVGHLGKSWSQSLDNSCQICTLQIQKPITETSRSCVLETWGQPEESTGSLLDWKSGSELPDVLLGYKESKIGPCGGVDPLQNRKLHMRSR
jgi:hypothetical protein